MFFICFGTRMKQLPVILLIISLVSCCKKDAELNGHWHFTRINRDAISAGLDHLAIDIINDTFAVLDKTRYGGMGGYLNRKEKTIRFGGECLVLNFRHQLENDHLILNQEEFDQEGERIFIGIKCDSICCDEQEEFFGYSPVQIDLPTFKDTANLYAGRHWPMGYIISIEIGKVKKQYSNFNGEEYKLVLSQKIASIQEMDLWEKVHLIKLPESKRHLSKTVIYADKSTPIEFILPILYKLKEMGKKEVYFAGKESSRKFKIWYKAVNIEKKSTILLKGTDLGMSIENK
jgi:hypothetical protein